MEVLFETYPVDASSDFLVLKIMQLPLSLEIPDPTHQPFALL
jgi:hypothetical protein